MPASGALVPGGAEPGGGAGAGERDAERGYPDDRHDEVETAWERNAHETPGAPLGGPHVQRAEDFLIEDGIEVAPLPFPVAPPGEEN